MTEKAAEWYIPGKSDAPNGPLTEDDVFSRYRNGLINEGTLCWRISMHEWLPLSQVEPFATAIKLEHDVPREIRFKCGCGHEIVMAEQFAGRSVHCKTCGKTVVVPQPQYSASPPAEITDAAAEEQSKTRQWYHSRKVVGGIALGCVLVVSIAAIWIMPTRWAVSEGEQLIADEDYAQAAGVLREFVADHPRHRRGVYLYALALLNEYALTPDDRNETIEDVLSEDNPLEEAGIMFAQALDGASDLIEQARTDLADTAGRVPPDVSDRPARQVAIGELQKELGLIDGKQVACQLLHQMTTRRPAWTKQPPDQALVLKILDDDPSLVSEIIGLMLPETNSSVADLTRTANILEQWGQAQREIRDSLPGAFLKRAEGFARGAEYDQMEVMLAAAGRSDSTRLPEVAELRLGTLRARLEQEDIVGVVRQLDRTVDESSAMRTGAVDLYLSVAGQYAAAGQYDQAEQVVRKAAALDPGQSGAAYRRRMEILSERIAGGDAEGALRILDRTRVEMSEYSERMAGLYLEAARRLERDNAKLARSALEQAFQLDTQLTESEQNALLAIQFHPRTDLEKLQLCRAFLEKHPDSSQRPQVLLTIVGDATELLNRRQNDDPSNLAAAGESAARELLTKYPTTASLDVTLYAFCQALLNNKQAEKAAEMAQVLLAVLPDTPLKPEVDRISMKVRQDQGRGTLPAAWDDQADRVAEEYENCKKSLQSPSDLAMLCQGDNAARIIEVARSCTAKQFNPAQTKLLQQWVADGGVLLVNNDVLTLFEIEYKPTLQRRRMGGECRPATAPESCPILRDCECVVVTTSGGAIDLSHKNAIPLLRVKGNPRSSSADYTIWSLVRYGNGLISDVKEVALDKYDGARFWLNFRLYCLGRPISADPGNEQADAPLIARGETGADPQAEQLNSDPVSRPDEPVASAPAPEPPPEFNEIANAEELEQALVVLDQQRVLWIRLPKSEVSNEALKTIRGWVRAGGVLWLDTDLIRSFGFTFGSSELREAQPNRESGVAEVFASDHPVTNELVGEHLSYTLSPDRLLVAHKQGGRDKYMTPLLGWAASTRKEPQLVLLVCAIRNNGDGVVIYRPTQIDTTNQAGERFEQNLRDWSVEWAQRALAPATP